MLVMIVIMTMLAITVCLFSLLLTLCKSGKENFSFRTVSTLGLSAHSDCPAAMGMARALSTRPRVLGLGLPFLPAHVGLHVVQHLIGRAVREAVFVVTG